MKILGDILTGIMVFFVVFVVVFIWELIFGIGKYLWYGDKKIRDDGRWID